MTFFTTRAYRQVQPGFGDVDPHNHIRGLAHLFSRISLLTHASPALQDTGSAHGWPWQLFGLIGVTSATTHAHLRPQGTEG